MNLNSRPHLTEYELYVKVTEYFSPPQHSAAAIFNQWLFFGDKGKPFYRAWRWNNTHRHAYMYSELNAPLHDDGRMVYDSLLNIPYMDSYWIIVCRYPPETRERVAFSLHRIDAILQLRRLSKQICTAKKINWWIENVFNGTHYYEEYTRYQTERLVPDLWLSTGLDNGLSFKHIRISGYIPFIQESESLVDERNRLFELIETKVHEYEFERERSYIDLLMLAVPMDEYEIDGVPSDDDDISYISYI
jgi:hypothetical protein